ncbi:transketolase family protein [Paenibacillus campi]|uniref:transketolase family protein n=1 Tax=Paenibacillus campi TaxID=3106031 RepID=UPI002B001A55|nr:transketolase C-terminal domain-containing protein [Paenibacillus sp. SGZ-1014]
MNPIVSKPLTEWRAKYKGSAREVCRQRLLELASDNADIYCLDSDMGGLETSFGAILPDQYVQVGIAEANMMTLAAALAAQGKLPFVHTMATFAATRACEQIKIDIAYNNLPVKIVASHAGISAGYLGPTHHALEDIAIMRALPNMTVIVPADCYEASLVMEEAVHMAGPVYIRLGREQENDVYEHEYHWKAGTSVTLKEGHDVTIIAAGAIPVEIALQAEQLLQLRGISTRVINMHTIKPLDQVAIVKAARETQLLITVEEHNTIGGLGSAVTEVTAEAHPIQVIRMGFKDIFCEVVGNHRELYEKYNFTVENVISQVIHHLHD